MIDMSRYSELEELKAAFVTQDLFIFVKITANDISSTTKRENRK